MKDNVRIDTLVAIQNGVSPTIKEQAIFALTWDIFLKGISSTPTIMKGYIDMFANKSAIVI